MKKPIQKIINKMMEENVDIAFFDNPNTVYFLTGFRSDPHERILATIILKNGTSFLFTPALDEKDAKNIVEDFEVFSYLDTENPWEIIKNKLSKENHSLLNWAIEKNYLTLLKKEYLESAFPESHYNHDFSNTLELLKLQKNPSELEKMKQAGYWADESLRIGAETLKVGITELEVVAKIEYELKKRGIKQMSFDTMVLFGKNAASPHGEPGNNRLEKDQFVLFDLGVVHNGYTSDVTRTLFFGDQPSEHQREVYETVLKAHDQAMQQVQIGMTAEELDAIARDVITNKGYGVYFNHRLGHGLGQSVHEYPSIMSGNKLKLDKNMCFSIEPGIYITDDVGVRIEDCGYLDEVGFHSFTSFPTDIDTYKHLK
ncbi:Xaa-Pro peptidase family protein [Jeotgalibaca sp. MA1X17-3]|uniref:aminopeptidase P family protein n=1 Tax=Jeotgalibaca sp. MA1X17-3 TaxID=2908211 RepID=UPI001F3517EF|nr:Xaa-Pro peptidase family protein [Jeotgalibaca sp. MA1X17-3]UJF14653.1 Xaa-Pro peptidase family protein [Jeotgalibaca sp. MA1X17-3]